MSAAQQAHLPAFQQISHGCGGFAGIAAATGDRKDEVAERKPGPVNFA